MSNRKLGNSFESELCEILFKHRFWTHNLAQNQAGQPADIIAVRDKKAYLIDCKVCSGQGFPLSRVEENQDSSMCLWRECGNGEGYFAIRLGNDISMVPHFIVAKFLDAGRSYMTAPEIYGYGIPLMRWIEKCK
jgi:Holliday junction resolvase